MSNDVLLIIMGVGGVGAVVLIIMAIVINNSKKKELSAQGVFVSKKSSKRGLFAGVYYVLEAIPFTRRFVRAMGRRYEIMYPGDRAKSTADTMKLLVKIFIMGVICLIVIFGLNPGVYTFLTALFMIYVFGMEFSCSAATNMELKFLDAFDQFLSQVKHNFFKTHSTKAAIDLAREDCKRIMRGHAEQMYNVMDAADGDLAMREYMSQGYSKFLKLFLLLAFTVEENGDSTLDDGSSAFLNSIQQLRSDIQAEKRYIQKRGDKFKSLTLTASIPLVAVPYIAWWGQDTIPSLVNFYSGHTGFILKCALMCISIVSFNVLTRLREGDRLDKKTYPFVERLASLFPFNKILNGLIKRNYAKSLKVGDTLKRLCEKYTVRTFYMLKCCYFAVGIVVMVVLLSFGHIESRHILLTDISDLSNISTSADGRQIQAMERVVPQYTQWIIQENFQLDPQFEMQLEALIRNEQGIRTDAVAHVATVEILTRVKNYRGEVFGWLDCVVTFFGALLAYWYPSLMLSFRKALTDNKMEDEVMQFQSLLYILREVPGMSPMRLLEQMESFAEIFKPALQHCLNNFNVNDKKALEDMYMEENYPAFRRIVDCFLMVDDMGIINAFNEIASEITSFKENRELERELQLNKEGTLATIIGVIPGGLILGGYLLAPFLIRSVAIFNSYNADVSTLV